MSSTPHTGRPYLDAVLEQPGTVLAFAHRGGAYHPDIEGLENTMAAFRHAHDLGYRYLETDVHATADGVLLAFHDAVLDRVTDTEGEIGRLTHAEVRAARVGGREEVPTLEQLFEEFPDTRFNIDLKSAAAVPQLASFVAARDALGPGARRVVLPDADAGVPAPHRGPGRDVGHAAGGRGVPRPPPPRRRCGSPATSTPSRCPAGATGCRSPPRGCCAARTPPPSTSTSGPSTTPPRWRSCSSSGSTGCSPTAPTSCATSWPAADSGRKQPEMSSTPEGIADLRPLERERQQKAWYWYDWANSAFYTTVLTVLFAPYMIEVAGKAAGCVDPDESCDKTVSLLGLDLAAGSLPFYLTSFATIASAFVLPIVGAMVDRSAHKKRHMAVFAWAGAACGSLLFFMQGENWQIGAFAVVTASILAGCSVISYSAILVDISTEDERDRVSSRGWAFGYLGGGLLLVLNLGVVLGTGTSELSVRLSLLSACLWWAGFTLIPFLRLKDVEPQHKVRAEGGLMRRSFGQLWATLKELRGYPMTLTFLVAYLFYNDGIQTVIYAASTYGTKTLGFSSSVLIATILVIQFVAFGGALLFGRLAERHGAYRIILAGTFVWMAIVVVAIFLPRKNVALFLLVAVAIGIVLGGTQALSRSFFSLLIPRGREGEYFALYNACERGTSWLGTLVFGVVFQLTGSYRPAILALIVFFAVGTVFLLRLDPARGIREAGNRVPASLA